MNDYIKLSKEEVSILYEYIWKTYVSGYKYKELYSILDKLGEFLEEEDKILFFFILLAYWIQFENKR